MSNYYSKVFQNKISGIKKIEDKIMVDPREICGPIAIIYRSHLSYMAKELKACRIVTGQFDFLMVLHRKDGISQENLAKILKVSKETSTRAI
jgi:hypothetical protein